MTMKLTAQVKLTLHNADKTDKRDDFYKVLLAEKWSKIPGVGDTWKATFKEDVTAKDATAVLKSDLEKAQRATGISWNASISLGVTEPISLSSISSALNTLRGY